MKFLVIGLGSIGVRHAKNLLAMGHEVYGLDIDESKYSIVPEWKREAVDGSIICSPTEEHASYLSAAAHGGRHIFVEKPIASRLDDEFLKLGLQAAKQNDLVVMVGNNLRFRGCVQSARDHLSGIGQVCATFILSQKNTKYKDHVILNWGAHELDLARYLLGPAKVIQCTGTKEDADIILQHKNGNITNVHLDYLGDPEKRQFLIMGDKGNVYCDLVAAGDSDESYISEMKAFIDRINYTRVPGYIAIKNPSIGATAEDGLATLKLIEDAMEMAK